MTASKMKSYEMLHAGLYAAKKHGDELVALEALVRLCEHDLHTLQHADQTLSGRVPRFFQSHQRNQGGRDLLHEVCVGDNISDHQQ